MGEVIQARNWKRSQFVSADDGHDGGEIPFPQVFRVVERADDGVVLDECSYTLTTGIDMIDGLMNPIYTEIMGLDPHIDFCDVWVRLHESFEEATSYEDAVREISHAYPEDIRIYAIDGHYFSIARSLPHLATRDSLLVYVCKFPPDPVLGTRLNYYQIVHPDGHVSNERSILGY